MREGLLIQMPLGGWGEAAPLPGWSKESLADLFSWLDTRCGEPPPSLQAAFEMPEPGPRLRDTVPINALLFGHPDEMIDRGRRAIEAGCQCLKIKAACLSARQLLDVIAPLADAGKVRFRIDTNRAWDLAATRAAAGLLAGFAIEFFEEPTADEESLRFLIAEGVPVALDERLRDIHPEEVERFAGARALVLKPTLMGGFAVCRTYAEVGHQFGMRAVVSACYESGVGISALGRFAASLPEISDAGLDTYHLIEEDLLVRPLDLSRFEFNAAAPPPEINHAKLVF